MASGSISQPGQSLCRRWWVISTALTETFLFSGVLLGWNALLPMLKSEGVYSHLCDLREFHSQSPETTLPSKDTTSQGSLNERWEEWPTCIKQENMLNLGFTVGAFFLGFTLLPLQIILDNTHLRHIRQIGSASFCFSCLLLAYVSSSPQNLSFFLMFAMVTNGIGGACIMFTTLTLPTLLGTLGWLYTALALGTFSASATIFTLLRVLYSAGISFIDITLAYGGLSFLVFMNCFFSWSIPPCTAGKEGSYSIQVKLKCCDRTPEKPSYQEMNHTVLKQAFLESLGAKERLVHGSKHKILSFQKPGVPKGIPPLSGSLCSPVFILHLFTSSIVQVWVHFYIGALNQQLKHVTPDEYHRGLYSSIFGALQVLCLLSSPVTSYLLGLRQQKSSNQKGDASNGFSSLKPLRRQISSVRNLIVVFSIRNVLICLFGVICLIPSQGLQILGFILHTLVRSSMFSSCAILYAALYPANHFGGLMGFHTLFSVLMTLGQHPLFLALTSYLQDDPFWIHAGFLIFSFLGFTVPFYLHGLQRTLEEQERKSVPRSLSLHVSQGATTVHIMGGVEDTKL
ncbi:large neutral amino acids transporter small subunit 4-like isoform X1 [Pleurodeles waltl]|uniref:large neutral amino acids transporter small subunit 4-like isoform X1 n=1 Tax=Pleurodeles waltl TaxID=8319 RepID=UPI003709866C